MLRLWRLCPPLPRADDVVVADDDDVHPDRDDFAAAAATVPLTILMAGLFEVLCGTLLGSCRDNNVVVAVVLVVVVVAAAAVRLGDANGSAVDVPEVAPPPSPSSSAAARLPWSPPS